MEAIGNKAWKLNYDSIICSDHFRTEDFYKTKYGPKIKDGAVPVVKDSSEDINSSAVLKVCRICLAMDRKLYHIIDYKLDLPYQQITGLMISEDDNLPQKLCWECRHRLVSCQSFRCKAIMCHKMMINVLEIEKDLTVRCVNSLKQSKHSLSSTLKQKKDGPDYCDIYIKEEEAIDFQTCTDDEIFVNIGDHCVINEEPSNNAKQNESVVDQNEVTVKVNAIEHGEVVLNSRSGQQYVKLDDVTKNFSDGTVLSLEQEMNDFNILLIEQEVINDGNGEFLEEHPSRLDCSLKRDGGKCDEIKEPKIARMQSIEKKKKPVKLRKLKTENKNITKNKKNVSASNALIDSRFTVTKLTFEEQLEDISKRKDSLSYKTAPYKCDSCYRGFLTRNSWKAHNRCHNDRGDIECEICKRRFTTKKALKRHTNTHAEKLSCNRCNFVTQHRNVASQHIEWHDGVTFKCQRCPSEFKNRSSYMNHARIRHATDCVCGLCGYAFVNKRGLFLHKRLSHKRNCDSTAALDGPYCEVCEVRFASETAYDTHLKVSSKHSTDGDPNRIRNAYTCKDGEVGIRERGERCARSARLSTGNGDKSEAKLVDCEQCGMQLEGLKNYMYHFKREHPDKHRTKYRNVKGAVMCDQCGKIYQSRVLLLNHMWIHTGEKRFRCLLCDKKFSSQGGLMLHQMVHSGPDATYDCEVCGKGFSHQSNLRRHFQVHSEQKPFKCVVCEKTFKSHREKRAHYDHVHLKKPWPYRPQRSRCKAERNENQP